MSYSRRILFAILVAASGCAESTYYTPTANVIVVHAVLDANARTQNIIVQRTAGAPATQGTQKGAIVTVTTPAGLIMSADEVQDSSIVFGYPEEPRVQSVYRISLDKYGVTLVPGGTYSLAIQVPGVAETIRGMTIIPGSPPSPQIPATRTFSRSTDTLSLVWSRVQYARRYEVSVLGPNFSAGFFADTSLVLPGLLKTALGYQVFWAGASNRVTISAVDANYYDYYRKDTDDFVANNVVSHLEGAIGLFGSISRVSTQVLQVR